MFGKKWPIYEQDEIDAVTNVLKSNKVNYWTGEQGKLFEKEYAEYLGVSHTIAVANGTSALELCLHALGIGPGDEVIVPCRTFMASASCVVEVGAKPVVCDIDPVSQNLTVATITPHVTAKTKAIICVHLGGWPCDMPAIMAFAEEHNLYVIEDCAQAHGAKINGKPIGSSGAPAEKSVDGSDGVDAGNSGVAARTVSGPSASLAASGASSAGAPVGSFGHMAAFSFCQDKIISTMGEGGLVATDNEEWFKKAWAYKDHGKGYDTVYKKQHAPGFRWLHDAFGSNYRMTEAQAAIGRIQLRKLPEWQKLRERNANILNEAFTGIDGVRLVVPPAHITHAYYRFYIFVDKAHRDSVITGINQQGLWSQVGSCSEIYLEEAFVKAGLVPKERYSNAKALGETSVALLIDHIYDEAEMRQAAQIIRDILKKYP